MKISKLEAEKLIQEKEIRNLQKYKQKWEEVKAAAKKKKMERSAKDLPHGGRRSPRSEISEKALFQHLEENHRTT